MPIPFFEIFEFMDFGSFTSANGKDEYTISELAMEVYEKGYDARHGGAIAIPLVLCDLMIKFIWSLKKHFYSKCEWKDCIPTKKHADLRIMLILGNMSLCLVDGTDAAIRSGGNVVELCLHLNIVAWLKFIKRVYKELEIRFGFTYEDLKVQYQYIDLQLKEYLEKLKNVDYSKLENLIADSDEILLGLDSDDLVCINNATMAYVKEHNIEIQYESDEEFFELMEDDDSVLKL